jgi:tetratricopeptide (TPR) repeat protein
MTRLRALFAVLAAVFGVLLGAACGGAQQMQITTNGWCSPVFVNVAGPVSVKCDGVDPAAVATLNKQLVSLKLSRHDALQQANEWAERYHRLEKELAHESDGSEMAKKAEQDLRAGNLEEAVALLKQLIATKDEPNLEKIARHYYETGLGLEMEFKTPEALHYLETAQRLEPDEPKYTLEYARALVKENRLNEAGKIFDVLVPKLHDLTTHDIQYGRLYTDASIDAGMLYTLQGDLDKARDTYNGAFASCLALGSLPTGAQCDLLTLTGILGNLGAVLLREERYGEAEKIFQAVYEKYEAASTSSTEYASEEASVLTYLGYAYAHENKTDEALGVLNMALAMQKFLLDQNNPDVIAGSAQTDLIVADLKTDMNNLEEAEPYYSHAAEKLRGLVKQDADAYSPGLERALYIWGRSEIAAKRYDQAGPVYEELVPLADRLSASNPSAYLEDLAVSYNALAQVRGAAHQTSEAEGFRKQCAATYRKMDRTPENLASLAVALEALAWDAGDAKDFDLAQTSIGESEQILRSLYTQDHAAYADRLGQALVFEAVLAKTTKGDCDAVTAKLNEATQISSAQVVAGAAQAIQSSCSVPKPNP